MPNKFKVGDKVSKPKGYAFDGIVVAVFTNTKGETRLVAELENNGMLHIFTENQLELRDTSGSVDIIVKKVKDELGNDVYTSY